MRKVPIKILSVLLISLMLCSFRTHAFQYRSNRATQLSQKAARIQVPVGIRESLWRQRIPKDNPMSPGKVALGRALYFDKRLSIDGTVSCASCHDPALAFTDS